MKEDERTGAGDQPSPKQRARAGDFRENHETEQRRPKQRRVAEGRDYVGRRSGVHFPGAGSLLHAAATGATPRTRFGLEKAPAFGYRFGSPISKSLL